MFDLLQHIAKNGQIEKGLMAFFETFEDREAALFYWRLHFEQSEDKANKKVIKQAFEKILK